MEYILNGANMLTKQEAHAELKSALALPEYYGANLDALCDVLSGMQATVRMEHTAAMLNALQGYGCTMLRIFYESPVEFIAE